MKLIDAEQIIKSLLEMKTQFRYNLISIDSMIDMLENSEKVEDDFQSNEPLPLYKTGTKRLTWTCRADGYDDVGLRDGVSVGDAIYRLAEYEDIISSN